MDTCSVRKPLSKSRLVMYRRSNVEGVEKHHLPTGSCPPDEPKSTAESGGAERRNTTFVLQVLAMIALLEEAGELLRKTSPNGVRPVKRNAAGDDKLHLCAVGRRT
jgi:hypothetical protein